MSLRETSAQTFQEWLVQRRKKKKNVGAGLIEMARVQGHDANKLDTATSCMYIRWWRSSRLEYASSIMMDYYHSCISLGHRVLRILHVPFTRPASAGTQSPKVGGYYLRTALVL